MTDDIDRRLLIAGGGVGGLCAAIAARSVGWSVQVFERSADPRREAGTAFNLWGNAITALDRIGLADAARATGEEIERMRLFDHRGRLIAETPIGEMCRRLGTTAVNLRRAELIGMLLDACKESEIPVHLDSSCHAYRRERDGVVLVTEDGTETRGAALVGADGARSVIRSQLVGDGEPVAGSLPVRGICELDGASAGVSAGTVLMVWGPRGGGGGFWPLGDGTISWTVGTNSALRGRLENGCEDPKREVLAFLDGFPEPLPEAVRRTPAERIVISPVLVRPQADKWGEGPVTLLGDAAHAMPTVFAQGACQALEDGVVLAEELRDTRDAISAFRRYEQRRKPRMDWLRKRVFSIDRMQKFENRLFCTLRNTMMRRSPQDRSVTGWEQMMTFGWMPQE